MSRLQNIKKILTTSKIIPWLCKPSRPSQRLLHLEVALELNWKERLFGAEE